MKMKTTVLFTGLSTSFSKDGIEYLVSTIHRKEFGGYYQTSIIKKPEGVMVYRIEVASQLKAAQEHVDTVRMALSKPLNAWDGTKNYQNNLMDEIMNKDQLRPREMSWTDQRIKNLILAANINYKPGFLSRFF